MPPHCDSLDGPVVRAAREALETADVVVVLPFVPKDAEQEVRDVFAETVTVRDRGEEVRRVADRLFFETVVRLHRAGEGAPYTGLKPAGLSVGPVIPLAEEAVESCSADRLADLLTDALHEQLQQRLEHVCELEPQRHRSIEDSRRYVEAMLGFQVYSHRLYQAMLAHDHHEGVSTHG